MYPGVKIWTLGAIGGDTMDLGAVHYGLLLGDVMHLVVRMEAVSGECNRQHAKVNGDSIIGIGCDIILPGVI